MGRHPVVQGVLDAARAAHTRLETTIDPERLVYVAGYDRPTPYRVRIDKPGGFSFQETRDGDGRVPHELGLLDGVATYWVDAGHGDLAKSEAVLDAIADLLQRGATDRLPATSAAAAGHGAGRLDPRGPDRGRRGRGRRRGGGDQRRRPRARRGGPPAADPAGGGPAGRPHPRRLSWA